MYLCDLHRLRSTGADCSRMPAKAPQHRLPGHRLRRHPGKPAERSGRPRIQAVRFSTRVHESRGDGRRPVPDSGQHGGVSDDELRLPD